MANLISRALGLLLAVSLASCGGEAAPDDAGGAAMDAAADDAGGGSGEDAAAIDASTAACEDDEIGTACEQGTCGAGLRCYEAGEPFCAPERATCLGFSGDTDCPGDGPICTEMTGTSEGACLTPAEKACVCERTPGALGDC